MLYNIKTNKMKTVFFAAMLLFTLASCSKESSTELTECNLGDNRFEINEGDTIYWHVRSKNGLINEGQADFKGCFRVFGGINTNVNAPEYYEPIYREGDTSVNFLGKSYAIEYDYLDSLVCRYTERETFAVLRLSK